jgi:AcrR family transcriptional regulator
LLIDAAEQVFANVGYHAATTNAISARAKVSPGTLYQFFTNKESLAEALASRFADQLSKLHESLEPTALAQMPLDRLTARIVDPLLDFHRKHPAFNALFVEAGLSPNSLNRIQTLDEAFVRRLATLFTARADGLTRKEALWTAEVCCAIFKGFLPLISSKSGTAKAHAVRELKAALVRYVSPILDRSAA